MDGDGDGCSRVRTNQQIKYILWKRASSTTILFTSLAFRKCIGGAISIDRVFVRGTAVLYYSSPKQMMVHSSLVINTCSLALWLSMVQGLYFPSSSGRLLSLSELNWGTVCCARSTAIKAKLIKLTVTAKAQYSKNKVRLAHISIGVTLKCYPEVIHPKK